MLASGKVGNRGGGRTPEAFKQLCRDMVASAKAKASVKKILEDDRHPHFAAIYKHLCEHGYGKATQPISGPDPDSPLTVQVIQFGGRKIVF